MSRSTRPGVAALWALAIAALLLIGVVLPAEYGVDPTGIGRVLKLTPMGERKMAAAQAGRASTASTAPTTINATAPNSPAGTAPASAPTTSPAVIKYATASAGALRQDEIDVKLAPGGDVEYKAVMAEDAQLVFSWDTNGTPIKFDFHGEPAGGPSGAFLTFDKGTAAQAGGTLRAPFTGTHGWYWKNPSKLPVTIKLRVSGFYSELKPL